MRMLRLLSFFLSASLLPILLIGCGSTTSNSGNQNPQNPTNPGSPGASSTNATAAYVYVANQTGEKIPGQGPYQIVAYSADANGQLTPISGSPFNEDVGFVEVHGSLLAASSNTQPDINTYKIGSDGALSLAGQFDYSKQTGYQANQCGAVTALYFDRSGQSLYAAVQNYQCSNNNAIASFAVDPSAGSLNYLGILDIGYDSSSQLAFLGNSAFAYAALDDGCMYGGTDSYARGSNGLLTAFLTNMTPAQGPPPPSGAASDSIKMPGYSAALTATDNANHIVIAEDPCFKQDGVDATQIQLATWTADATGSISTADTSATMPATKVTSAREMKISPDGALLAVAGTGGLQVFHFNGASPVTPDTDLLTTDPIAHIAWDSHGHLYAATLPGVSPPGVNPGKLYVFTVSSAQGADTPQPAPGSPYPLNAPWDLAVQSQ